MEKILILGGSGLIGKALINELSKHDEYEIHATYFKNPVPMKKS